MKIGFLGSHGTGKTTMAYDLAAKLKKRGHDVIILSEVARSCPMPINQEVTREAQNWIIGKHMTREASMKGQIMICDRTLMDNFAYALYCDEEFFKPMTPWIKNYMQSYTTIFYLEPNDAYLIEDGTRDTDIGFRNKIDKIVNDLIDELQIKIVVTDDCLKHLVEKYDV